MFKCCNLAPHWEERCILCLHPASMHICTMVGRAGKHTYISCRGDTLQETHVLVFSHTWYAVLHFVRSPGVRQISLLYGHSCAVCLIILNQTSLGNYAKALNAILCTVPFLQLQALRQVCQTLLASVKKVHWHWGSGLSRSQLLQLVI